MAFELPANPSIATTNNLNLRNLFFLADFLLRWYAAESRTKFLLNSYVLGKFPLFQSEWNRQ